MNFGWEPIFRAQQGEAGRRLDFWRGDQARPSCLWEPSGLQEACLSLRLPRATAWSRPNSLSPGPRPGCPSPRWAPVPPRPVLLQQWNGLSSCAGGLATSLFKPFGDFPLCSQSPESFMAPPQPRPALLAGLQLRPLPALGSLLLRAAGLSSLCLHLAHSHPS